MIAAGALILALATPSRDALIERWLHANRANTLARLRTVPGSESGRGLVPSDLHALAQRELSTAGRYQLTQPVPTALPTPWWQRLLQWLADRWQWLWKTIFGRVHVGKTTAAGIGDVLLVLIALLLIVVLMRLIREIYIARGTPAASFVPLTQAASSRALYNRARERAGAGDYGAAALLLFAALIALLDRRGLVDASSSATVGELRRGLRRRHAAWVPSFDAVAAAFVQTAYAERPVDEAQWQHAQSAYIALSAESLS